MASSEAKSKVESKLDSHSSSVDAVVGSSPTQHGHAFRAFDEGAPVTPFLTLVRRMLAFAEAKDKPFEEALAAARLLNNRLLGGSRANAQMLDDLSTLLYENVEVSQVIVMLMSMAHQHLAPVRGAGGRLRRLNGDAKRNTVVDIALLLNRFIRRSHPGVPLLSRGAAEAMVESFILVKHGLLGVQVLKDVKCKSWCC